MAISSSIRSESKIRGNHLSKYIYLYLHFFASDSWLEQLDEDEAFQNLYMRKKREKGVFSDDEDEEEDDNEIPGEALKKKFKRNTDVEQQPGKYDKLDRVELL